MDAAEIRELRPGECIQIPLQPGDLFRIENLEGGAEVYALPYAPSGSLTGAAIGLAAESVRKIDLSAFDARTYESWVSQHVAIQSANLGYRIFDHKTEPGDMLTFEAVSQCILWLVAPTRLETLHEGGGGGVVQVHLTRAVTPSISLPAPLGDIRDEFTVDRATARSYRVNRGEVIQVIDVRGRQCSDFMALRSDALDQGTERFIESNVTRSMVGGAYPGPGLYDKFYDQDMQPLLNVVQDTVGRHDTFALACTARGYEERGFPGHVNCSDNISDALDEYGVQRRRAWPAINFFFNSWILPTDNRLQSDEAWSRPGDYVAMQAMDDLVCVSTACPDDIDPINGWNPTEIHVRIYRPEQSIRRSVAYRASAQSEAILSQESAFHPRTSKLTQRFSSARDLWLPDAYAGTGAIEEYWACREGVTVQDLSSLRKFDIMGPDAGALLQHAMTRNIAKLAQHRGMYSLLCDDTGAVIDDGTLFHIAPQVFRWCCGSDESARHLKVLAQKMALRVWIKSQYSAMPNIAIQGPRSREVLRKLVFTQPQVPDLENLKWFGCTVARLHDRDGAPFMLTRSGFTGELGFEIFCDRRNAVEIWDEMMTAGSEFGIAPMGNTALEMIRIEAGLMVSGAEFGGDVDALEAGLGFAVDFKKENFVGRAALVRNAENPKKKLVGLIFGGDEHPGHGDGVFLGERQVGLVTSATHSPILERAIALARVAIEYADEGTALEVGRLDGHMKRLSGQVSPFPFVDPKRERARA